jgi:hypothetical protein
VETIISHIVARFEKGSLNWFTARDSGASGERCRCSRGPRFQRCEHRPRRVHVASGPSISITRCSASLWSKVLDSLNHGGPPGIVDHFAIAVPRVQRGIRHALFDAARRQPLKGDEAGLHLKDPVGINVQISHKA